MPAVWQNGGTRRGYMRYFMSTAKFPWAEAGALFELSAEMFHISVAAEFGYRCNRFFRIQKLVFGQPDPGPDTVVHAGKSKGIFVDGLQIAFGKMELLCHQGDAPGKLWTVVDGFAQRKQLLKA